MPRGDLRRAGMNQQIVSFLKTALECSVLVAQSAVGFVFEAVMRR
jgi:hypothetical protein